MSTPPKPVQATAANDPNQTSVCEMSTILATKGIDMSDPSARGPGIAMLQDMMNKTGLGPNEAIGETFHGLQAQGIIPNGACGIKK